MKTVRGLPAPVLLIAVVCVFAGAIESPAQTAPPAPAQKSAEAGSGQKAAEEKPAPAGPAVPPETKALRDASQITDLDKQIEALKKVVADYPGSATAGSAEGQVVSALTRKTTNAIKALQDQAKTYVESAGSPNEQARRLSTTAGGLAGAGVLLDEAEQYAKKSLALLADEAAWIAAEKKAAAETQAGALKRDPAARPRPVMSDADYASRFTSARQNGMMTLAQIYEKQGNPAGAEKTCREAYALSPKTGGAAALKLADYAKASGHLFDQFEYLTAATLAGRATAASRAELEAVYKKTHGGTTADLDRMLDERYAKDATKVEAHAYTASKTRTNRVVLAELFTGAGCGPCVAADLALEAALERYTPKDIAVLVYHLHIPRPDPMTNPSTVARKEFYDVPGTPTYFIDGGNQHVGGGAASSAQKLFGDTVQPVVDRRLEVKPAAEISLEAKTTGDKVDVAVRIGKTGKPGRALRLQIALVEEAVHYTGENGVRFHPMVVRSLAAPDAKAPGLPLASGKGAKLVYTFDIAKAVADAKAHLDEMEGGSSERFGKFQFIERRSDINRGNLRIVAWVQDEKTKEVLQAARAVPKPAAPPAR